MAYLKSRLLVYFTFWSIFFFLGHIQRALLLLFFSEQTQEIPFLILTESFLVGSRFDGAIAAYCTIPLFLISFILHFFKLKVERKLLLSYFVLLSSIYIFLMVAELEYFSYFNTRFTAYVFNVEGNTKFLASMIWESYPVVWYLILIIFFVICLTILFNRVIKNRLSKDFNFFNPIFLFIIVGLLLFISARGRLEYRSPLRWGHAFFSSYPFANKLALNGIFSLAADFRGRREGLTQLFKKVNSNYFSDNKEALISTIKYIDSKTKFSKNYKTGFERSFSSNRKSKKYNIVLIIGESFSNYYVNYFNGKNGRADIAPNFRQFKKQGYFFKNYFSNGIHTHGGVFSSLSGMPHNYGRPMMKRTEGQWERTSLAELLKKEGYHTLFMIPHTPSFDNMGGYLTNNGFDKIISFFDFPDKDKIKVGIPDHIIFDRAISEWKNLSQNKKPFFMTILTFTNHQPFITPKAKGYKVIDNRGKIFSTFHYMDWSINQFFKKARKMDAFHNTIFIVTGDHGNPGLTKGNEVQPYFSYVNIPLLFYAPKIIKPGQSDVYSYQADLMPSILHWLGISYKADIFGRNLFQKQKTEYAFFRDSKVLGFIEKDWYLLDRIGAKPSLFNLKGKNPLFDLAEQEPILLDQMRKKVRGLFLSTNQVLLSRKNVFSRN